MNVDQVSKGTIAVEHVESADVAGFLSFGQGGLIFALTYRGEQPTKVFDDRDELGIRPYHSCKRHRSRQHRQFQLQMFGVPSLHEHLCLLLSLCRTYLPCL